MTAAEGTGPIGLARRLAAWTQRSGVARRFGFALALLALASGIATYIALTHSAPFGPDPNSILILVNVNLALFLIIVAFVARRVVQLWAERRRGSAGSRLHVRLVVLFSLVAVTPAIVVAVFSVLFLNFGMQSWFSERVRTALRESLGVASAYLDEQQTIIRLDVLSLAQDLTKESPLLLQNPAQLGQILQRHAVQRGLPEVVVVDSNGDVRARLGLGFALDFDPLPSWALERARTGDVPVMTGASGDRLRAIVKLPPPWDGYLSASRFVDAGVLNHVKRTQDAVLAYEQLEGRRSGLQINFAMLFAVLSLLLLMAAVWIGLMFATQLARPISSLIAATERVRAGELGVRVEGEQASDEMGTLSRAFNRMTGQIENQQRELMEANRQLDTRRRFTEAVLAGVSAGVIGLDETGRIHLPNRSAQALLSADLESAQGRPLSEAVPEMAELFDEARRRGRGVVEGQIRVARGRHARILLVRVTVEAAEGEVRGYVVTFDDVTELLSAQRKAAWADVARRIAHEIKNPLTPIQLSAERLKRKYLKEITSDRETFEACTDTIVRQVGDIGRMVDEFSAFARMPAPVMKEENAVELCSQAIFLQQTAHSDISFVLEAAQPSISLACDARQMGQVLTNLLKNAAESIASRPDRATRGQVTVRVGEDAGQVVIEVEDNGVGFPAELRDRLTEPYVTTRAKGTGLGLAIVRKIMEDHGGALALEDREGGGARARLQFGASEAQGTSIAAAAAVNTASHAS